MTAPDVKPAGQKKPKRKKPARQNWSAQCDAVFGRLVRAPGRCVECGSTYNIQCAHGLSRRYRATRWDLGNAFPLCQKCHMFYTYRPLEWDAWLLDHWGRELYDELKCRALLGAKVDLKAKLAELRELEACAA